MPGLLQLRRSRRIARRISKRHRLRDRHRALTVGDCAGSRPAIVIGPIDVRRDEEQDFTVLSRRQLALEEVAENRNRRQSRGALLRFTGEPSHPLSFLGQGTRNLQLRSMALFRDAMAHEKLPDDLRAALPTLLWSLHMGLLLYFLYDGSPRQRRTRVLTDGAVELVSRSLSVARQPLLKPLRRSLWALLEQADLLASDDDMSAAVRSHEGSGS